MPPGTHAPAVHRLVRTARRQLGLFLVSDAEDAGIDRRVLRQLRTRGQVRKLTTHVYEVAGTPDTRRKRMLAALLSAGPHAVLSHASAGWLHGLFDVRPDGIEILYPHDRHRRRVPGAQVHTSETLDETDTTRRGPFVLTTAPRTVCDLARPLDPRHLRLVVLDAWRRDLTTPREVATCLDRLGRVSGATALQRIVRECDPAVRRARSTWEAEALVLARRANVPPPVINLVLHHADGTPRYELDVAWPHLLFAYELQSRQFHSIGPDAAKDATKRRELGPRGGGSSCSLSISSGRMPTPSSRWSAATCARLLDARRPDGSVRTARTEPSRRRRHG